MKRSLYKKNEFQLWRSLPIQPRVLAYCNVDDSMVDKRKWKVVHQRSTTNQNQYHYLHCESQSQIYVKSYKSVEWHLCLWVAKHQTNDPSKWMVLELGSAWKVQLCRIVGAIHLATSFRFTNLKGLMWLRRLKLWDEHRACLLACGRWWFEVGLKEGKIILRARSKNEMHFQSPCFGRISNCLSSPLISVHRYASWISTLLEHHHSSNFVCDINSRSWFNWR